MQTGITDSTVRRQGRRLEVIIPGGRGISRAARGLAGLQEAAQAALVAGHLVVGRGQRQCVLYAVKHLYKNRGNSHRQALFSPTDCFTRQ